MNKLANFPSDVSRPIGNRRRLEKTLKSLLGNKFVFFS